MMVTKNLTIEVSDDFNNDTFLKASPQDKTEIINIGTNILTDIKHRLLTNYKNSSDRQVDIDNLIKIETDKVTEKHYKEISDYKSKCSNLEGEKEALECQVNYMTPQLTELNKTLFNNDNKVYDEVQKQKQKIRNDYKHTIETQQDTINKLRYDMKQQYSELREREDSIRKSCEDKIEEIRTKYENMNSIYNNSSKKGKSGEIQVNDVLHSLLPTATITDTHSEKAKGDFHILINNVGILYENKNYDSKNVPKPEIKKFIRDVEINSECDCGILACQKRGIATRSNLSIDFTENGKPMIFLHKTLYNENNIKLAVEVLVSIINNEIVFDDSKLATINLVLDDIKILEASNEIHKKNIEPTMRAYKCTKETICKLKARIIDLINDDKDVVVIDDEITIDDKIPIEEIVSSPDINSETPPVSNINLDIQLKDNLQTEKKQKKPKKNKKHISKKNKNKNKQDSKTTIKKPQSGYFLWMNTNRKTIKQDLIDKKIEGNISILVAKEAGKIWNIKTDEEKNIWKEKAKSQIVNT